jgi:hypothetical protein
MNFKELLKILPKNPNEAFNDAQSIKPVEGGILLVERHEMNFGYGTNYGNHIWFFRTPKEFVDFLPALLFFDIAIHWDDNDRNYISYDDDDDIEEEEIDDEVEEEDDEECDVRMIEDTEDYSETYELYKHLCKIKSFDDDEIYELEGDSFGEVEVIEVFGISELINVSEEIFNLTLEDTDDEEEIDEMGLTWCQFKILNGYAEMYDEIPSKNVEQFLDFLMECNHDWLELSDK